MEWLVKTIFPDSKKLMPHEAPGIYKYLENISQKAGCSVPPVYLVKNRSVNAAIYPAGGCMLVFQGLLDMTNDTLHGTPSEKLQGVLAHEMGHWKHAISHFGSLFALLGGAGIIASASVYLYDLTQKQHKKDKEEGKNTTLYEAFSHVTEQMKHESFWKNFKNFYSYYQTPIFSVVGLTDTSPNTWGEYFQRMTKNTVAQMIAAVAVLPLCRPFALRNEYHADKFAVTMTGKPEVYINLMEDLHKTISSSGKAAAKALSNPNAGEQVIKTMTSWVKNIFRETIMAHPSCAERVTAIRKLSPILTHAHAI